MTYGAGEQDTPNGERAVCILCREQIHKHMEENTPQALCGRGAGVTETAEWNALLKLVQEIGSGAKPIKGWTPGTDPRHGAGQGASVCEGSEVLQPRDQPGAQRGRHAGTKANS